MAPQFTCQVPGCHTTFAADPGVLDRYLAHIGQRMTEERGSRRPLHELHSLDGALSGALSVKPNPFYKPPSSVHGVPRRQVEVMAPPKCRPSTGSRLGVLNIRWGFRKIFETKVREALEQRTRERKEVQRARRDSLSGRPKKRAKLDLEHSRRSNPSEDGRASTSSKSSKRSGAPKTKKTLQVRIGKRSQTLASQKNPSPCKTGCHRRGSTSSSAPSDGSGRHTNLASQGEVRVTLPNNQDPMRAGPTEQRLAWEEPEPLARAEPTVRPRDATAWAEVCPATSFETGQLLGRVGTPEEPLFTYEQAVHHRRGRNNLQLVVGTEIPTEERDRLSRATIAELNNHQTAVEGHRLAKLPHGVVPRGWDGWGRPWALINCPADKVPQVTSNQGSNRVTVAALVDFPSEPFYIPNATVLDYAMHYCSKAGKKGTLACGLTLDRDGQWEDPAGVYKRLKLPTCHHSVPVQELMRSHHWPAFQEGRWGNRPNPPIPEGDVRPLEGAPAARSELNVIELPPTTTSGSPVISVVLSAITAQSAQGFVPSSDREELADEGMELTVPASPPRTNVPRRAPSHAKVAEAITNMVAHVRQTGAPTASTATSSQRDSQASGTGTKDSSLGRIPRVTATESNPTRTSSSHHGRSGHRDRTRPDRPPIFPAHETTIRWTAPGAQPRWREEEPKSLEAMEESVRQVAGGATDVAADNLLRFMTGVRAWMDESLRYCEGELRNARTSASRFGPPGPVQQLMGQVQNVWNRAGVRQNRINALVEEKDQAQEQCDKMATTQTSAQKEISQLRAQNAQLQEQIASLRQDLLAARTTPQPVGPPSVSSASSEHARLTDQEQIRQLTATANRIRGEREALQRENAKLRTANEQWRIEADREKLGNDTTIDNLHKRWREAEDKLKRVQGLPSHQEMGGHIRLPVSDGPASPSTSTVGPRRSFVLPIPVAQSGKLGPTSSPQAPQPHRSASETSQETLGREEAMESDSQAESESRE